MTNSRSLALLALLAASCGGSDSPPPQAPEPAPTAAEPAPAEEPSGAPGTPGSEDPCAGADEMLEASVSFVEDVGALATKAQGDCSAFATELNQLVDERSDWIAEMQARSQRFEQAGCTDPEVSPEIERRAQAAMQPVAELAQTCQGNAEFEAAMTKAFQKQQ